MTELLILIGVPMFWLFLSGLSYHRFSKDADDSVDTLAACLLFAPFAAGLALAGVIDDSRKKKGAAIAKAEGRE